MIKEMVSRQEMVNHFANKYSGNSYMVELIQSKSDEELQAAYNKDLIRSKRETEILENGTVTYTIEFDKNLNKEVEKFMWDNDMPTIDEGDFKYRHLNDGMLHCVPAKIVEELEEKFDLKKGRERYVIGKKDINSLKVGDKVKVVLDGIFGQQEDQGTVVQIEDDQLMIRRYRSKSKGYIVNVGDECKIEKISKFQK